MPQSLSQIWLHVVFSPKDRQPFLKDAGFRDEMFRMLSHHVEQLGCHPKRAGGWIDHVHVVCGLSRTMSVSKLTEKIKTETSKWAKDASKRTSPFSWQRGYSAFSVSHSQLGKVIEYVDTQESHHKKKSFQDELRLLCRKHDLEIDERYLWD